MMSYEQLRTEISEGMKVRAADGDRLGKVVELRPDGFVIEKGMFFPKDYFLTYEFVREVRENEIWLGRTAEELRASGAFELNETERDTRAYEIEEERVDTIRDTPRTDFGEERASEFSGSEEKSVPLYGEELEVDKQRRKAGEVEVKKDVVTEHHEVTVPVRREAVHIEEVPASGIVPDDVDLEERRGSETLSVPLMEEEVEVTKRPVKKGEVRITKTEIEEERKVSADLKKEKAKVEKEGNLIEEDEHRRIPH